MCPLHSAHRHTQVFVHEKVKAWSASLETLTISVEDADDDIIEL
jgi:hypothetical protein